MAKDYYKILGVDEKTGKDEIKKKYRELAKKYHPDLNKGDKAAEEKFKDISEAYDVLGDDKKRQQYDTMRRFGGFNGRQGFPGAGGYPGGGRFYTDADFSQVFGGRFNMDDLFGGGLGDIFSSLFGDNLRTRTRTRPFRQRTGRQKGTNLKAEIKITLSQSVSGVTKKIRLSVPESCVECGGTGTIKGAGQRVCPRCNGTGHITNVQGGFSISRPCPSCLGRGVSARPKRKRQSPSEFRRGLKAAKRSG
jgi:molecular chaperone DnaJ